MELKDKLKQRRVSLNLRLDDISKIVGVSEATVSRWESGDIDNMRRDRIALYAKALRVSPNFIMGIEEYEELKTPISKILTKLPLYSTPVSAGDGAWLSEGHEYEFVEFEDVPKGTDYALRVRGDSMTPMYNDGDIVFVKMNQFIEGGQIGVFYLNGEGYLKMLQGNKLVSLNNKYNPIVIGEEDSFFPAGRIVGKKSD